MFVKRMTAKEDELLYSTAKETADFFGSLKIKWWLSHGTLLGAWRHQGIIPWDDDLDFAFPRSLVDVLEDKVKEKGWKFKRIGPFLAKIWNPAVAKYGSDAAWTWPNVDVTLYDFYKNTIIVEYDGHRKFQAFSDKDIVPVKLHPFGPLELPIPNQPEVMLNLIYPNWRTMPTSSQYSHRFEMRYIEQAEQLKINQLKNRFNFFNVFD
jgi:hypothetical protein